MAEGVPPELRDNVWRPRIFNVPRIGRSADPERDLADVMRTDALSNGYSARPLLGRHYTQHLRAFVGENLEASGFNSTHRAATIGVLQRLQLPPLRLTGAVYGDLPWTISGPLVQAGEVSPGQPLEPNYIGALLAATSLDALIRPTPAAARPAACCMRCCATRCCWPTPAPRQRWCKARAAMRARSCATTS